MKRFSSANWKKLPNGDKAQHTMKSMGCSGMGTWHAAFPYKTAKLMSLVRSTRRAAEKVKHTSKERPREALQELKDYWQEQTGRKLEDDLVQMPDTTLQKKPTAAEKKRQQRATTRKAKNELEKHLENTSMNSCLQDRLSFSACERQRKRASFESPDAKHDRSSRETKKTHSPTVQTWDTAVVLEVAESWPEDKVVNWSALAREHNVPGRNAGQAVKEYLRGKGVDVLKMEGREAPRERKRSRKLRFRCGVSFPVGKSTKKIKEDIQKAVEEGRYNLGEDCTGTILCKYTLSNGDVEQRQLEVHGRKISLLDLREQVLDAHEKAGLMRERRLSLIDYANMERNDVVDQLTSLDEFDAKDDAELETHELATRLYGFQHTRLLLLGSDHAHLLGHTYLLEVVQVVYDQSLFYSNEEYMARTGKSVNVQALVEAPFIRLLSMSGSSEEEQLRVVPDRAADLHCTRAQLDHQVDDPITNSLVGYIGDLQGRWFEADVQKGGEYRCGAGCGCPSSKLQYYSS